MPATSPTPTANRPASGRPRSPRVVALSASGLRRALADPARAVVVGVRPATADAKAVRAARGSADLAKALGVDVKAVGAAERAGTRPGDLTKVLRVGPDGVPIGPAVYLVGVGAASPADLRAAAAAVARGVRHRESVVTSLGAGAGAAATQAVVEGLVLGAYQVAREGKKASEPATGAREFQLAGAHDDAAVRRGLAGAAATVLARDLANTRSNVKGPAWLAARARAVARTLGLSAKVWTPADLVRDGFGAILAVGGGAERGPRLVRLDYRPTGAAAAEAGSRPHVALVGKGITFDTGGISLKPREAMLGMTTDMTGSAVVLAVLQACAELRLPVRVTGLMAIAENAFGAGSYRPGDVVCTYDGTTVEVRNTDAEGRMVLADAMGYARSQVRPDLMVDVATLTGAATMALGRTHAAMYSTYPPLARALERAGEASGERVWEMPLTADYRAMVDSDVADLCQISTEPKNGAGSIMAALFLREFAGDIPWAHLDIAGPGRSDRDRAEVNRGGTGYGVRLLLAWLESL